jgi:DNA polymerase-3 subunit delta'
VSFDSVVDQKRPKGVLQGALERGTLASAYLFWGPRGVGKLALALELAKAVNCQEDGALPCDLCSACRRIGGLSHPDVSLTFPTPKNIKPDDHREKQRQRVANLYHNPRFKESDAIHIDTIRDIEMEANYKPYEGRKKVFILTDAERMTLPAANALLKTLEEPPPNVLFILTAVQRNKLPATVLSRCQQIRFVRLTGAEVACFLEENLGANPQRSLLTSRLAQGNLGRAIALLQEDVQRRRSETLKILTTALYGDLLAVINMAEGLGRSRDRSISEENLETLQVWYRDLLLLLEGKEESLINQDLKPQLEEMANQCDWAGVQRSLRSIQEARNALMANVNLELTWMVLLFKLRRQRQARS